MKPINKYLSNAFFILLIGLLSACAAGRANIDQPEAPNLVKNENGEEEEYELIIIDPGYQTWFMAHSKPINFYSPSYYELWNQRYVAAWNEKVNQQAYYNSANYPFENRIEYNPNIDYGADLNYELYWYFRYIQHLYGARYNFPGFTVR